MKNFRTYGAVMALVVSLAAIYAPYHKPVPLPEPVTSGGLFASSSRLPNMLSQKDSGLYAAIFRDQKKADWKAADEEIAKLNNKILLGHVLATRYLSRHYDTTQAELTAWLNNYSDYPEASEIYAKAAREGKPGTAEPRKYILAGYGDDNGLAAQGNTSYQHTWKAGIDAWRHGRKAEAAKLFSSLSKRGDQLSPWSLSAAAYWAWRAYDALGDSDHAGKQLLLAATEPRSFYGILARRQLRQPLDLDMDPASLTDSDILEMVSDASVQRAIALAQAEQSELAERELRAAFPQADKPEKMRLLALAHALNLAPVQITMAKELSDDGALDYAKYPIPDWQPQGGFSIDPALVFALMRQESGFRASAVSPGGALGLMQLMPQTASLMQKGMPTRGNAVEPTVNVTLGQNYVQHLLVNDLVDGNLIYLLAAYNAGPGRLEEWKGKIHTSDPLLFVESIPYGQTRQYVMQVMANYWIYSEMLGNTGHSAYVLLNGKFPAYEPYVAPVASRSTILPAG